MGRRAQIISRAEAQWVGYVESWSSDSEVPWGEVVEVEEISVVMWVRAIFQERRILVRRGILRGEFGQEARGEPGSPCCGTCEDTLSAACDCSKCACGHCIHDHEKWRWHRACRKCTPRFYADEIPNEVDDRPLDLSDEEEDGTDEVIADRHRRELDRHYPADEVQA